MVSADHVMTVGLLMTDIEGSTRLLQRLGPAYADALLAHCELVRTAASAHAGRERSSEGDGFFFTFPSASHAVRAALDAQRSLSAHHWTFDGGVRVRMGVHVGEIEEIAGTVVGMPVHEAARIGAAAHGGQVLVSDAAAKLADPLPEGAGALDLGEHSLKDIVAPIRLLQLTHPDLETEFPPLRSQRSAPHHLPAQPSSFIGRVDDIADLGELLEHSRIVTVTGAGGAGKSRIALRVAAEFAPRHPDGTWLVDLSTTSDPDVVWAHLTAELGIAQSGTEALWPFLEDRHALIVVDNCEHLTHAVAQMVTTLVSRCSAVTILATSREPLGVQGEAVWRVPSMTDDDGLELLVERARAVNPQFELTDANRSALATICTRLDALPLALELAAARMASLSPAQVADRLDSRFRLLTGGARGSLSRHRTLQATVDWSYELLDELERLALRRIGIFTGGLSLEGLEFVCDDLEPGVALDLLDRLVQKSLVIADTSEDTVWFRVLETVRQYALDRLIESGEATAMREAHRRWVLQLAAEAERVLLWHGGDEAEWLLRLDREQGNVAAAFEWCLADGDLALALNIALGVLGWHMARGRTRETRGWIERIRAEGPHGETLGLVEGTRLMVASSIGPIPEETVRSAGATSSLTRSGSRPYFGPLIDAYVAAWSYPRGDRAAAAAAVSACGGAIDILEPVGPAALAWALQPVLWAHLDAENLEAAHDVAVRALAAARASGLSTVKSRFALNLSRIAHAQGALDDAWTLAEEAVECARATGEPFVVIAATTQLVEIAEARGEHARAIALILTIIDAVDDQGTGDDVEALQARIARNRDRERSSAIPG